PSGIRPTAVDVSAGVVLGRKVRQPQRKSASRGKICPTRLQGASVWAAKTVGKRVSDTISAGRSQEAAPAARGTRAEGAGRAPGRTIHQPKGKSQPRKNVCPTRRQGP